MIDDLVVPPAGVQDGQVLAARVDGGVDREVADLDLLAGRPEPPLVGQLDEPSARSPGSTRVAAASAERVGVVGSLACLRVSSPANRATQAPKQTTRAVSERVRMGTTFDEVGAMR